MNYLYTAEESENIKGIIYIQRRVRLEPTKMKILLYNHADFGFILFTCE